MLHEAGGIIDPQHLLQDSLVHVAAKAGAYSIISSIARSTANVSVPQKGMSRQAASDAAVAAVMSVSGRCGVTPLMLACERGHPRVARLLIDLDTACIDKCDDEGESKLALYLEP